MADQLPRTGTRPQAQVSAHRLTDDGTYPNNSELPALLYRAAFADPQPDGVEALLARHGWTNGWRDGVLSTPHYHSTAHEVLCCYGGEARIQLGGPKGAVVVVRTGDAVVIPAGVAHKNVDSSPGFRVLGAYPEGQQYDMMYGRAGERPAADARIARVPPPDVDPVYGPGGPLEGLWARRR